MVEISHATQMQERNIWFLRHGEKKSYSGNLSRRGRRNAERFGSRLSQGRTLYFFTSSAIRVQETVKSMVKHVASQVDGIQESPDLSMESFLKDRKHSEYFRRSKQISEKAYATNRLFGRRKRAVEKAETVNLQRWLSWQKDPSLVSDEKYTAFPQELARKMAPLLLAEIEGRSAVFSMHDTHPKQHIINVAHEYNAAAIVAEFFSLQGTHGRSISGYEILQYLGYRIPPLEGPRIWIYEDKNNRQYIFGIIGSLVCHVDIEKIKTYAQNNQLQAMQ